MNNKTKEIVRGTVGLFKIIPSHVFVRKSNMSSVYDCIRHGFLIATRDGAVIKEIPVDIYDIVNRAYGVDIKAFNQTFHKSFNTVIDMSPEQYLMEQIAHYFSTYTAENIGVQLPPYIPAEELKIPNIELDIKNFTVITVVEDDIFYNLINDYAANTVSPSKKDIELFTPLMSFVSISTDNIKSFELQVIKHDVDGTFPTTALTALRYLLYKTTNSTYAIKNRDQWTKILNMDDAQINEAFRILTGVPVNTWGEIFLRYKPIFLAYKHAVPDCASTINRIRKAAAVEHRPLSDVCVQNITKLIAENRMEDVEKVINKATNRELIKVANAIGFRLGTHYSEDPQVFNIRNGRSFVISNGYKADKATYERMHKVLHDICNLLEARLTDTFKDKKFIIPKYIDYAVPTTEKQFTGNLPWGTIIRSDAEAFTVGIQWYNNGGDKLCSDRVDIDLHLNSVTQHFGWNGGYKKGREIIYTGDMTSAPLPNGAAEAFWFSPEKNEKYIVSANLYSGKPDTSFKFAISKEKPSTNDIRQKKFVFRMPIFPPIPMKFSGNNSMTIGMFIGNNFHIFGGQLTDGIVPTRDYTDFIDGITAQLNTKWLMSEFLTEMGATIYEDIPANLNEEEMAEFIDLSPEVLTSKTLLDIVDGNI